MNKNCLRNQQLNIKEKIEEIISILEQETSVKKNQILFGLVFAFTLIWFGIFDKYLSYALTTFYPIIWTIKIIEKKRIDEDRLWLTYWTLFSIFYIFDSFSSFLSKFFPFYIFIKTLVLLWCYLPGSRGALIIYNLTFVEILKISKSLKFLESQKKNSLKTEVEEILNQTDEKENEIIFPNFETNKKSN